MSENSIPSVDPQKLSGAEEFLKFEYGLLNEWSIHSEDVAHRIFNFYISILTATLGGLFLLIQLIATEQRTALLVIAGASGLLFMFGVVFYDSLVTVNIRSAYYRASMVTIQNHFYNYPSVRQALIQFPTAYTRYEPDNLTSIGKQLTLIDFSFPGGNQQPLMAGINSLLLGVLIWALAWGIGGIGYRFARVLLFSVSSAILGIFVHSLLSKAMVNRNMEALQERLSQLEFRTEAETTIDENNSILPE
jgi:hypothetical protein